MVNTVREMSRCQCQSMQSGGPLNANGAQVVSPFPPPPEYAKHYTSDRVAQGAVLPPPPFQTEFVVFGEEYKLEDEIIRSLASQKVTQIYPHGRIDWKNEMKKLNRSVVAAFLDLLEVLIRCPGHPDRLEKLTDIQTIFINMHHLINEYRPLQARDTIRLMQLEQVRELEEIVTRFRAHLDAGKEALRSTLDLSHVHLIPIPAVPEWLTLSDDEDESKETEPVAIEKEKTEDSNSTLVRHSNAQRHPRVSAKPDKSELRTRLHVDMSALSLDE